MRKAYSLLVILALAISLYGCSPAFKKYDEKISTAVTPKEIFDIDIEIRFLDATGMEKKELRKKLGKKGIEVFVAYTTGMLQGNVIADRNFINSIRAFANKYKQYVGSNGRAIFNEILSALDELDSYLNSQGK